MTKWVLVKTGHYQEVVERSRAIKFDLKIMQEPPPEEAVEVAERTLLQTACLEKGKWVPL